MSAPDSEQPHDLEWRRTNQEAWARLARSHGQDLAATASTAWVREGTLRRLRRVVRRGDHVLEVGCGNGNLLRALGFDCGAVGIDLSAEMLRVAHAAGLPALARADAVRLPFRDANFDVVYSSRCLINLPSRTAQRDALGEILRVVKPRGTVVLIENFAEAVDRLNRARARFRSEILEDDPHNLRLDVETTLAFWREQGWTVQRSHGYPLSCFFAHVVVSGAARRRGGRILRRLLAPLVPLCARLDDVASRWLPYFGKDTTFTLRRCDES